MRLSYVLLFVFSLVLFLKKSFVIGILHRHRKRRQQNTYLQQRGRLHRLSLSEIPKLPPAYLEPPTQPPPTCRLTFPRSGTSKKVCKRFFIVFSPFLTAFLMSVGFFLLTYTNRTISREPPHRGLYTLFRRSGADMKGYENTRGVP